MMTARIAAMAFAVLVLGVGCAPQPQTESPPEAVDQQGAVTVTDPVAPVDDEGEPVDPEDAEDEPVGSVDAEGEPVAPVDAEDEPVDPVDAEGEPVDPVDAEDEPTSPLDSQAEPIDPSDPEGEPVDPSDPEAESVDPLDPEAESADPSDPEADPVDPSDAETAANPMDESTFWELIESTRAAAGNDTGRQSELLADSLTELSPDAIVEFERIRQRLDERAYTWDLWGAAYVIEDGCSDDCFRDFRNYVISLGRDPFEAAMRDPDSLAVVAEDAETGNWENADTVAGDAYSSVTGGDFPLDDSDLSGRPAGTPWDEDRLDELAQRYPRLFARFR